MIRIFSILPLIENRSLKVNAGTSCFKTAFPAELLEQFDSGPMTAEAVMAEVVGWHARPLERMYPAVFFDTLRVKVREEASVRNKAIDLVLAVRTAAVVHLPRNETPPDKRHCANAKPSRRSVLY